MHTARLPSLPSVSHPMQIMNQDKIVLRFACRLLDSEQYRLVNNDRDRRFVLNFFAADDTVAVFEPPQRNSGIVGGKFLQRAKVFKPGDTTVRCCGEGPIPLPGVNTVRPMSQG